VATEGVRLTDEQKVDWLRLIRSENVGPRGIMAQTPEPPRGGSGDNCFIQDYRGRRVGP
jgi:hypothetical protein